GYVTRALDDALPISSDRWLARMPVSSGPLFQGERTMRWTTVAALVALASAAVWADEGKVRAFKFSKDTAALASATSAATVVHRIDRKSTRLNSSHVK